jgi:pimeloyl-ACP methyl ester carboxylesterase
MLVDSGSPLVVDDGGHGGLPVVFAHSLAGNLSHWQAQLDHLRPARRAIAFDFRGHGRSAPARDGAYSIGAMATDIGSVVNSLELERLVLVGHSMGGGAALVFAAAHRDRVAGLFLVDPIGDGKKIPPPEAQAFLTGLESDFENVIEQYWAGIAGSNSVVQRRLLSDLSATPRAVVIAVLRSVLAFDPEPALARYQGPILSVVSPSNDQAFSLHRLGNGFPHQVVTGTGHWIQLDRPDEVNRLIDEFLNRTVSVKR